MKKWVAKLNDESIVNNLMNETSISKLCSEVLVTRGVVSKEMAIDFVTPSEIENPFNMIDMDKAVNLLNECIDNGETICIYGDYDCDGITSTAMLKMYLELIGANVFTYIPERSEGYGLNTFAIDKIHEQGANLIITVDNGISAHIEAEYIYKLGMKLIITDHHQPSETLPKAEAIVNPHRKGCQSKFKYLCGAGVVFKLIMALEDGDYQSILEQFGDLVSIATIGDIVQISGENRKLVSDGLNYLKHTDRVGILALCEVSNVNLENINSTKVAFQIVPRINASGRFGSPKIALELLTCEDEERSIELAKQLFDLNNQRKDTEKDITLAIERQIEENPQMLNERVLIFVGEDFHHGVIGIVASKICEKYDKPCFILTKDGDNAYRGSARGIGSFSIFKCLEYSANILERFGGHQSAGGFSLLAENVEKFKNSILTYANENFSIMPRTNYNVDKILDIEDITLDNVKNLSILEPFGEGNQEPMFLIKNATLMSINPMANNTSVRFNVYYRGQYIDIVKFRTSTEDIPLKLNSKCDFLVGLYVNSFNGREKVSIIAKDYRLYGVNQKKFFSALDTYEKFNLGIKLPKVYVEKIRPTRDELKLVYSYIVRNQPVDVEILYSIINRDDINYCKLRICVDIFAEMKLISFNPINNRITLNKVSSKVDLEKSTILQKLSLSES
ncbi:MAG: single-stranded-DNA-specific exonuclease RecJ [Oscillospiraceae bacterium]